MYRKNLIEPYHQSAEFVVLIMKFLVNIGENAEVTCSLGNHQDF